MNAAIYARKSTDQAGIVDEQRSIARQIDHAKGYAAKRGWTVDDAHVFVDENISGAEFAERPGFVRLMRVLKPRPPFQILVMSEESRLGREAIETAYALKQIISAGVRVFFYLEDRERTLNSPTDKIMLSLAAYADELEREKARQRTYDAMLRKAMSGYVTGGGCFGYRNVTIVGPDGRRSHVERQIDPEQAAVVREIFELCAAGNGLKRITKHLNSARRHSPRPQLGRPASWATSSVRAVLRRHVYRGEIIWNKTRKRDVWGQRKPTRRDTQQWIRIPAPALRIVSEDLWRSAHLRLAAAGVHYSKHPGVRPGKGMNSPYLLTQLAACGKCGGPLHVLSSGRRDRRAQFYGCAAYHLRGQTACANGAHVPMADADRVVIQALMDTALDETLVSEAITRAIAIERAHVPAPDQKKRLERDRTTITREIARLTAAIVAGGQLDSLLVALREREQALRHVDAQLTSAAAVRRAGAFDEQALRARLKARTADWKTILQGNRTHARAVVESLLEGRVTFTPESKKKRWRVTGVVHLTGLFERTVSTEGSTSPTGIEPSWKAFDPEGSTSPAGIEPASRP